jgi:hypothetical protein
MTASLADQTIERCRKNLRGLDTSRRLLAHSRRLLHRAWWMAGASDDDLRMTIRARLATGALFQAPEKVWAGPGTGRTCVVCGTAISAPEIETEMILGPVTIWAHSPCYTIWRQESDGIDGWGQKESTDYLANLRTIVRARIRSGILPVLLDSKSRVGRGTDALCMICDKAIFAAELAQEPVGSRRRAPAHLLCYRAWSEESRAVRRTSAGLR